MIDKLIDFLIGVLDLFKCWTVLNEYERGVLLRLGRFKREVGPGWHWQFPFSIDVVLYDNVVARTVRLPTQSLTTADGRDVAVTGIVTATIEDIRSALLNVEGVDHVLVDACTAGIAHHVESCTWDELRAKEFGRQLTRVCRRRASQYGVRIHRVQLADRSLSRTIRLHTSSLDQSVMRV